MFDKMKQLMEFKKQAEALKRELDQTTAEINEGGIKIIITGSQQFQSVDIAADLLKDKNKLENTLTKSLNAAVAKSQAMASQKMKGMAGFNIPGM